MFKSSENLRLAAEMRALERVARPWREARTSWFDGTPESIEARLASTERVLTYARGGFTQAHLDLTREASLARAELVEAKHRLMVDFLDDGARAFRGSRRVFADDNGGSTTPTSPTTPTPMQKPPGVWNSSTPQTQHQNQQVTVNQPQQEVAPKAFAPNSAPSGGSDPDAFKSLDSKGLTPRDYQFAPSNDKVWNSGKPQAGESGYTKGKDSAGNDFPPIDTTLRNMRIPDDNKLPGMIGGPAIPDIGGWRRDHPFETWQGPGPDGPPGLWLPNGVGRNADDYQQWIESQGERHGGSDPEAFESPLTLGTNARQRAGARRVAGEFPLGPGYDRPGFGPEDIADYEDYLHQHDYHTDDTDFNEMAHRLHPGLEEDDPARYSNLKRERPMRPFESARATGRTAGVHNNDYFYGGTAPDRYAAKFHVARMISDHEFKPYSDNPEYCVGELPRSGNTCNKHYTQHAHVDPEDRKFLEGDNDDDVCAECGASLDDGEGYDGYCGNCADRFEEEGHWS